MRRSWILGLVVALAAVIGVVIVAFDDGNDQTASDASDDSNDQTASAASDAGPSDPDDTPTSPPSSPPARVDVEQIAGDPRESVPSALEDMEDSTFPEPLVDPSEIRSGGPPPDGIPPIDNPRFEPASAVDWLDDVEPVLLVQVGDEARAYPLQVMTWHEIVNDTFGDVPVTVSYCPLCNSAIVYIRKAGGRTFDFGTSGRLYNSSLVMYDRQTESLWSHFTGQAVIGTLTGTTLETLPVSTVSWATFRGAHPDALVLSRDTGFNRDYGRNPYPGYDDVNQAPFLFDGDLDGRLPAQTRVVAVRGASETIAVPLDDLAAAGVITVTVDDKSLAIVHTPGTASALDSSTIADGRDIGTVGVYHLDVADTTVALEANGDGAFVDIATGTTFDILGTALAGDLQGERLEPVEHLDTFWFAIAAFEPDTRIITE